VKLPGTYNARRDNLEGYWRKQFGYSHGIMVANAFYENVSRHKMEGRELAPGEKEENVILEFRPNTSQDMLVACLWSHWQAPGQPDLWSFAAITDDPPPEVAAAGHDRCIIPIKPENVEPWLNPDPTNLAASYAILADREQPYYDHRLAA
jgi:putative SOS response-associated peptidase YedK